MVLIVGLGNPGKKYLSTRHNLGFWIIDEFARENNFPEFRLSKKFNALISKKDNIILAKPQTFMNQSGKVVKKLNSKFKIQNSKLIVIHDDIDLPLGKIKIVKNRGAAGHKGVESVMRELGTKDFIRFRIGIQPKIGKPGNVEKFVLQKFDKEEEKIIKQVIRQVISKLKSLDF